MQQIPIDAELEQRLATALRHATVFKALEPQQLTQVAEHAELFRYNPGESIVTEGDPTDFFMLILQGNAHATRTQDDDRVVDLGHLAPLDAVGELGLLLERPHRASVQADNQMLTARFDAESFAWMHANIPQFGLAVSKGLAERLVSNSHDLSIRAMTVAELPNRDPELAGRLPHVLLTRFRALPWAINGTQLITGFASRPTPQAIEALQPYFPAMSIRPVHLDDDVFDETIGRMVGVEWRFGETGEHPAVTDAGKMPESLSALLRRLIAEGVSDLHLIPGYRPRWRRFGHIDEIRDAPVLSCNEARRMLEPLMPEHVLSELAKFHDVDFSWAVNDQLRARASVFLTSTGTAAVLRLIPCKPPTLEELGILVKLNLLCRKKRGLLLVVGGSSAGRTTTMAAILDHINRTRRDHIITIEDPIEFVHESRLGIVSQREVGRHVHSYQRGISAALREDPDVLMLGELHGREEVELALDAANTGRLVLATMLATNTTAAIDRIIDFFPADRQPQIRTSLGDALAGIVYQCILNTTNGRRVAAHEILIGSPAIGGLIRENKTYQIPGYLPTGQSQGARLLNEDLALLVVSAKVDFADALDQTNDRDDLYKRTGRSRPQPTTGEAPAIKEKQARAAM